MKLLIIEANQPLAELTAALLESADRDQRRFQQITVAGDLETALCLLRGHDAVLCDDRFPLAPGARFIVEDWDVVQCEAARRGIRFVLYTGSPRALAGAKALGAAVLAKPAPVQEVYDALARARPGPGRKPAAVSTAAPAPLRSFGSHGQCISDRRLAAR